MSWRAFRSFAQIRAISCTNSPFVRNIRTKSLFIASSRGNGAKHCGKTGQKAIPTLVVEHKELAAVFLFRRDFLIQFEPFTTAAGFDVVAAVWLPHSFGPDRVRNRVAYALSYRGMLSKQLSRLQYGDQDIRTLLTTRATWSNLDGGV
jgi:hypothetical protein